MKKNKKLEERRKRIPSEQLIAFENSYNKIMEENNKDWSKATDKELKIEAMRRYPVGCHVNQRTAYTMRDGSPSGMSYANIDDLVVRVSTFESSDEICRNVAVGGCGVYNTEDNKWAEIVDVSAQPKKENRKK